MAGVLLRTKSGIEDCARHLNSADAFGTEIESYLTQHLLVVLCADIQQEIYRLSEERASLANDAALSSYVSATARRVLRSVQKSDIAKFVGMFGADSKARLNSLIEDSEITIFNNAVFDRHDVAHKQGSQITFQELQRAVTVAEKLLSAVDECLRAPLAVPVLTTPQVPELGMACGPGPGDLSKPK
jgi:hypothetical protein